MNNPTDNTQGEANDRFFRRAMLRQLLDERNGGRAILSFTSHQGIIRHLANDPSLTDPQRDHLADRLIQTWSELSQRESGYGVLEEAVIITEILQRLDRPRELDRRSQDVAGWLDAFQVTESRVFRPTGGYGHRLHSRASDLHATHHAVQLMQIYGIPDSVDQLALRASIRPTMFDRWLTDRAAVRFVARSRLDTLPDLRPITWRDHLERDRTLWFAMLLVGICVYAMSVTPRDRSRADTSREG